MREVNCDLNQLQVRLIKPDDEHEWDVLMSRHHYLGFRRLVGETLKYIAEINGKWLALIGWGTAAFKNRHRDRWIGWAPEQQWSRLKYIANNQRFLILPGAKIQNLASKTLSLNLKRLAVDWEAVYGHPILLAETFVDLSRFNGTCYLAANWTPLGISRGFGRTGGRYFYHGQPKLILVHPLRKDACRLLRAPFCVPEQKGANIIMNFTAMTKEQTDGLLNYLAEIGDPRKKRGIRHPQLSILAIAVGAVLSGCRNFSAIGEWAGDLPQRLLKRLGCRRNSIGQYVPPSEPTLRRTLQSVDPDEVDRAIGLWLLSQQSGEAVAVDGKTLRGAVGSDGKAVNLIAAFLHKEGIVAAQIQVDKKSNEITAVKPLLDPLDLKGKVITLDALHTQIETARYVKEEKQADYVLFVKGNQPGLLKDIQDLDKESFSP